jgi:hypothetical protein
MKTTKAQRREWDADCGGMTTEEISDALADLDEAIADAERAEERLRAACEALERIVAEGHTSGCASVADLMRTPKECDCVHGIALAAAAKAGGR